MFRLETGERFTVIGCSDFNLLGRYLTEGEAAIRPVLQERHDVGFNLLRVWTAYWGTATFEAEIGRLVPAEHPDLYDTLPAFLALCASYGCYVELTAFTGGPIWGHWERLGEVLQGITNVLVELTNENDAHRPQIDPTAYRPIAGVLCSHGSNASQHVPVRPWWQYEAFHTNDAYQWPRKVGHGAMELSDGDPEGQITPSHLPVTADENTRPDHDGSLNHFFDAAASATLLCSGATYHCASGKKSALFDARDRQFAEAWVAGARSVPLDCQDGDYRHRSDLEGPNAGQTGERVYQRGDDPACLVHIRPH